ncbi:GNAT family N-acetyltransferase [Pedobacter sp. MC2016-05]|uniref:GNAT family N-acetyltransferase n=1 Tax=Pedobacter sp. MC2016-05 TaxID=2994474 RepID=UPI002244FD0A|nr:GNAT family N-acetyltransferase [Pedobacter sp. MC2016-05]MCX2476145.1 GNAT family N-acetyltransferase [Pedobacter sp. MC2016-05]
MQVIEDGFLFSDQKELLQIDRIHSYLSKESYWAKDIPSETVAASIQNSLCFGIYKSGLQIGFARWVTDKATFGWLCDVYVEEGHRGNGLAKKLISFMIFHPDLQNLRRYQLATHDAHELYEQFGFSQIKNPENQMAISISNPYNKD